MTRYVALLRAVNVGGTGKLAMADLRAMCSEIGLTEVVTYIASGNVMFQSDLDAREVKAALEIRLSAYAGKAVPVMVRDADEIRAVLAENPFDDAPGNKVVVVFLDDAPAADALDQVERANGEMMALGVREIYVHYPDGQGVSKLKIPAAAAGTARNMNTVAKLVEMVGCTVS
jgi:uncharacterized protein (DUF1697 family)